MATDIVFFLGSDISSHFVVSRCIAALSAQGHRTGIVLTKHVPSKTQQPLPLRELAFYERGLLNEVIYPAAEYLDLEQQKYLLPSQLRERFKTEIHEVDNVNDPVFIQQAKHFKLGISVRCYQKFGEEIIDQFRSKGDSRLWNLHPGILPAYRGVMTYFRAMQNNDPETSYTLHIINPNWDAGDIIDLNPRPLNYKKSMLANYCNIAPSGAELVLDYVNRALSGQRISTITQDETSKEYYTFPKPDDLSLFARKGLVLVRREEMVALYLDAFAPQHNSIRSRLKNELNDAIDQWNKENVPIQERPPTPA